MIPSEVADIAELICEDWSEQDAHVIDEVLGAAWRIYNAGYRRTAKKAE